VTVVRPQRCAPTADAFDKIRCHEPIASAIVFSLVKFLVRAFELVVELKQPLPRDLRGIPCFIVIGIITPLWVGID
jgi:branched-subunit amino acid transport protein